MKEIKYRAKSIHWNIVYWYYVYSSVFSNVNTLKKHLIINELWNINEIEVETLCQFTWLYDKNWEEIYEWDIIQNANWIIWEVFFCEDDLQFKIKENSGDIETFAWYNKNAYHFLEVIGNIFENSNLIK
jgi:uncharacterized phage protein (TIGR01671 family)